MNGAHIVNNILAYMEFHELARLDVPLNTEAYTRALSHLRNIDVFQARPRLRALPSSVGYSYSTNDREFTIAPSRLSVVPERFSTGMRTGQLFADLAAEHVRVNGVFPWLMRVSSGDAARYGLQNRATVLTSFGYINVLIEPTRHAAVETPRTLRPDALRDPSLYRIVVNDFETYSRVRVPLSDNGPATIVHGPPAEDSRAKDPFTQLMIAEDLAKIRHGDRALKLAAKEQRRARYLEEAAAQRTQSQPQQELSQ